MLLKEQYLLDEAYQESFMEEQLYNNNIKFL